MSDFKKKSSPKPKAVKASFKKEAPKKEVVESPKKSYRETLADLKADYLSAAAASPKNVASLRTKYKEDKKDLKASY